MIHETQQGFFAVRLDLSAIAAASPDFVLRSRHGVVPAIPGAGDHEIHKTLSGLEATIERMSQKLHDVHSKVRATELYSCCSDQRYALSRME